MIHVSKSIVINYSLCFNVYGQSWSACHGSDLTPTTKGSPRNCLKEFIIKVTILPMEISVLRDSTLSAVKE